MYKLSEISPENYSQYVGLLTETDKDLLIGQWYMDDSYFNPIQDNDDRWVISVEEISQCVNPDFSWVQNLPLIPYVPKPAPPFPG
jgi:succinate dehydrogenase flavin-adding protein (antitoxin of CptAB toxin-antitoxin module)